MEFVSAIVGPVKRPLDYLISSKMKMLDAICLDVKNHMESNKRNDLEVPVRVLGWLEEVEKIKEHVEGILGNGNGSYNMKTMYRAGRNASKIFEHIEDLIRENQKIIKLLGRVNSEEASTSALSQSGDDTQNDFKNHNKMSSTKEFEHLKVHLEAIKFATNDFNNDNYISRGGFGNVYKGELIHSGRRVKVAVKRLDPRLGQGTFKFWKEIMMLSRYKHENLVSLLGFCDEDGENILVYEYLSNKSLDMYLGSPNLLWIQRLNICIGAARGLKFLHNPSGTTQRVLHRDIKSSNILLDENWNAKISDFGLSKLGPANQEYTFLISHPLGTKGYCDPLYEENLFLTKEADVYSFGVVLFEVLCGRLCIENYEGGRPFLPTLAQSCYEEKKIRAIVHNCLQEQISQDCLDKYSKIAYQCLRKDRKERPPVAKIVKQLEIALEYQEEYNYKKENMSKAQAEPLPLLVQLSEEELNA